MSDASAALTANGDAVNELLQAAERCGTVWTQPRAPGKWSPATASVALAKFRTV